MKNVSQLCRQLQLELQGVLGSVERAEEEPEVHVAVIVEIAGGTRTEEVTGCDPLLLQHRHDFGFQKIEAFKVRAHRCYPPIYLTPAWNGRDYYLLTQESH